MRTFQWSCRSFTHAMGDSVDARLLPPGNALTVADVGLVLTDYNTYEKPFAVTSEPFH